MRDRFHNPHVTVEAEKRRLPKKHSEILKKILNNAASCKGLENRGEPTACVPNDARNWTHFVLVYVHVLRVRGRVGCVGVL